MTLFERVFGGNDYNYARTVAAIDEAIAAYGESEPVSFPGTAYSLPCYYGVTGVKITTARKRENTRMDVSAGTASTTPLKAALHPLCAPSFWKR